jgi:hypothetical protein
LSLHNSNTLITTPLLQIYTARLIVERPKDFCLEWQTFGGQIAPYFAVLAVDFDFPQAPIISINHHAKTQNFKPLAAQSNQEAKGMAAEGERVAPLQNWYHHNFLWCQAPSPT